MLASRTPLQVRNQINEYTEHITSSLSSRASYCELKDSRKDSHSTSTLSDSFPIINTKYINNSLSPNNSNSSKSHIDCKIVNKNNIINTKSEEYDDDDEKEERQSKIFIKNLIDKQIYLLQFKATDVHLIPVYLKHRTFEENKNDKCNQPKTKTIYDNTYNNKSKRFSQLVKSFKIDKSSKNEGKLSVMSFKKPLLEKRKTQPPKEKPKIHISASESNLKQSIIYINYNNLDFKINPGLMNLRNSHPIDFEEEQSREKLLKDLKMALPGQFKNKAQIVVKHKGDVLKFFFTLSDINYSKMKVTTSIGIQAKDDTVYIKQFSTISNRKVYISVPKSNYEYIDVMVKQRRENRTMKFNKIDPSWLVEQRKKRFKEYNQCRRKNPYDDILELKIGSRICYESFNCLNKLKGGTLPCSVSDEEYERWAESIQRMELPHIDDHEKSKFESTFSEVVPDWDQVLNTR